jgi:hypothetical protein
MLTSGGSGVEILGSTFRETASWTVSSFLPEKYRHNMTVYPEVSRLAACCENCKWYSSQRLGAIAPLFSESV